MDSGITGKRVLVVEDEFFLADDIAEALKAAGAEIVGPVPEESEALDALGRERIDVAIVDISLRGHAAFTVADALAARGIPFVFATGFDAGSIPPRHAAVARWEKPFNLPSLIASLDLSA